MTDRHPRAAGPDATFRRVRLSLLTGAVAGVAACGSLTAGGLTGEAAVALSGDAPDPIPAASLLGAPGPARSSHDDAPEGEVEVEFRLSLVADDGRIVPLTDQDVRVRVDLRGVEEPEVADRVVETGRYTTLRIVFTEIEVEVDSGLVVNGLPVTGPVDVDIDTTLVVDEPIAVEVAADERVELLVDLNSGSWLQAVDPTTVPPTVDAQEVASLIEVIVR